MISSKNRLKFNVLHNDQREYITFQLEDILTPTKIQTIDSQIYNLSMITKGKNYKTIDQIIIKDFQNFAQYEKINPVDIRLTDPELHSKLLYYSKKYRYRFLANNSLFSSAIEDDISTIFITTNGLNDTKNFIINGKFYQGIGIIYLSEIENWDKIKGLSHWTNVILTDSAFPIGAKHYSFAFETADVQNLLNFEYSLISNKGELIKFKQSKDKIPALKFTIQII